MDFHVARMVRNAMTPKLVGGWTTHVKNISQNGNLPQIGVKMKNMSKHHPENQTCILKPMFFFWTAPANYLCYFQISAKDKTSLKCFSPTSTQICIDGWESFLWIGWICSPGFTLILGDRSGTFLPSALMRDIYFTSLAALLVYKQLCALKFTISSKNKEILVMCYVSFLGTKRTCECTSHNWQCCHKHVSEKKGPLTVNHRIIKSSKELVHQNFGWLFFGFRTAFKKDSFLCFHC